MTEQDFSIGAILSVVAGPLLCDIGEVYGILNWMSGESLFTHQLPRVATEAKPVILARHPQLQSAIDEADACGPDNYLEWLATWTARFGEKLPIPKMNIAQHERIDPLSELAEKTPDHGVIVLKL